MWPLPGLLQVLVCAPPAASPAIGSASSHPLSPVSLPPEQAIWSCPRAFAPVTSLPAVFFPSSWHRGPSLTPRLKDTAHAGALELLFGMGVSPHQIRAQESGNLMCCGADIHPRSPETARVQLCEDSLLVTLASGPPLPMAAPQMLASQCRARARLCARRGQQAATGRPGSIAKVLGLRRRRGTQDSGRGPVRHGGQDISPGSAPGSSGVRNDVT